MSEMDHLPDYHNILKRLKKEKDNYIPETGMRTIQHIDHNIKFFEDKIKWLSSTK